MAVILGWLWRVLPVRSFAKRLLDLIARKPKSRFTRERGGHFRWRKGDLEINLDWYDRHDQH
jgi:hypothetical protein